MGTSLFDPAMMPGSPSSIRQMMSLLQAPQQEPAAQEGQQPQMPPPEYGQGNYPGGLLQPTPSFAGPQKSPSMVERIMDRFRPKAPAGYEGLLSPEEIKSARPGLLQSLIGTPDAPGASQRYAGNLNNIVAMKQVAEQMRQQKTLAESRAQLAARFPEKEGETPQETIARLRSMFAASIANGDTEMAGKLGEVVKALGGERAAGDDLEWVDMGGHKSLVRKSTGEVVRSEEKSPTARDPNAPDTAALNREQKMFDRTNRLADDYRSESKMIMAAADNFRTLSGLVPAARAGSAQAQIGLVFGFMKSLDPGSTVRESEYATAQNAAGVPERVRNQYNKLVDGGFLAPEQVDGIAKAAKTSAGGWMRRQSNLHRTYKQRARRWGIDTDDVILDYFEGIEDSTPAAPTKSGGAVKNSIGGIR